jgi:polyribonucleotide nucleotidyltransferase
MLFLSAVIGKGGEQINKLQSETGARVQVAPGLFVTNYY